MLVGTMHCDDVDEQMMMMITLLTKNDDVRSMRLFGSVTRYT